MIKVLFISFCALLGLTNAASLSAGKIVGGFQIDISETPYQVSLRRNGYHLCGGSVIASRWILTAAHCTEGYLQPEVYTVRVGSSDRLNGGTVLNVRSVVPHPAYDGDSINYDFSLIELAESVGYSRTVQQVELPAAGEPVQDGTMCTVSGWGNTQNFLENNQYLRAVNVPSVNQNECVKALASVGPVTEQMICAGYAAGGKDSCQGDSGGPMVAGGKLVGVVSWGKGCALAGLPGVYARVSSVREWISEVARV